MFESLSAILRLLLPVVAPVDSEELPTIGGQQETAIEIPEPEPEAGGVMINDG